MGYNYTIKASVNAAKAVGIALPISRKESVMVCQAVRGMQVAKAKKLLEDVMDLKKAIPFTRYNDNMGHKHGMKSGAFPVSTCQQVLMVLKSAESNAQSKGLSAANLVIKHASAQKGPTTYHYGRQRTKAKRTHIELVLEEQKEAAKPVPKKALHPNHPTQRTEAKK